MSWNHRDEFEIKFKEDVIIKESFDRIYKFNKGDMEETFENAAYALKVNEYTKEPIKTSYGYHIIKKTKEYDKKELKEVKDDIIKTLADNRLDYNGKIYLSHSDILEDALTMKLMLEETFKNIDGEVLVNSIGTTIGSHTGPGTLALFFFGDKRDA